MVPRDLSSGFTVPFVDDDTDRNLGKVVWDIFSNYMPKSCDLDTCTFKAPDCTASYTGDRLKITGGNYDIKGINKFPPWSETVCLSCTTEDGFTFTSGSFTVT